MTPYAKDTTVSEEKSRAELDRMLAKHGASSRGILTDDDKGIATIGFQIGPDRFRIEMPLPRRDAGLAGVRARGRWEQARRERWRLIVLMVKTKFELVRVGASSVQREFMADMVTSNGETIGELLRSANGRLLLGPGDSRNR